VLTASEKSNAWPQINADKKEVFDLRLSAANSVFCLFLPTAAIHLVGAKKSLAT
jgi:hypothetical protein